MGFFDFLKTKNGSPPDSFYKPHEPGLEQKASDQIERSDRDALPEIHEEVFIEKPKPTNMDLAENPAEEKPVSNLQKLYVFLERNMEKKGYEDALINPDSSAMDEQILYLKSELFLYVARVKTYYAGYLRDIEFHIETRKRNGMVETVEELLTHQKNVADEYRTVLTIEDEIKENKGSSQKLILGYKIGFRNGFAAITYNSILGKHN